MLEVTLVGRDINDVKKFEQNPTIGNRPKTTDIKTQIMYPEQIFMIQEQPAMVADGRFYANLIFGNGAETAVVFKDEVKFNEFVGKVNEIVKSKEKK